MAEHPITGSRIRERRLDRGLRQADLAETVGISASYLNLIEHNKRRIGGKLLTELARALGVDAASLSQGVDPAVLDSMRSALARSGHTAEIDRVEELAVRFPGWAGLIASQGDRIEALDGELSILRDRMTHDPALAGALHNVITAVTSIQATAGILTSDDRIDADWQRRFHANILNDSKRLATESEALVAYLDTSEEIREPREHLIGFEEVEAFLVRENMLLEVIEAHPDRQPAAVFDEYDGPVLSRDGRALVLQYLTRFAADARLMPRAAFAAAAVKCQADPAVLAVKFGADLPAVLRRLASLPTNADLLPMGLAICDGTGTLTYLKAIPGFAPQRTTPGCPLWPLYTALTQPGRPIKTEVEMAGQVRARFMCYAVALPKAHTHFDAPPVYESTMLVISDPPPGQTPPLQVGRSCRVCSRGGCDARREPSVIEGGME